MNTKSTSKTTSKIQYKLENIKVSVIIPFYNRIPQLLNSIKSVINQSHKNIEILLINDGSTDNLIELTDFIKNYDNIKLINCENNSGPGNARNIGICKSKGEYICFLDSDDLFLPNKIEKQLSEMHLNNFLFSHTSYIKKDAKSETIINTASLSGVVIPKIITDCCIATPTIMFKRDYLINNNFKYDTTMQIGEDVCFYLNTLKNIPVLGIEDPLTIVNTSETSAAYNKDKLLLGIKNTIKFVLNDSDLFKYDKEISHLAKEYCYLVEESSSTFNYQKRTFIGKIKYFLFLYKNDRPKLKQIVFYKLRNHPKILNILRSVTRFIKKIFGKYEK